MDTGTAGHAATSDAPTLSPVRRRSIQTGGHEHVKKTSHFGNLFLPPPKNKRFEGKKEKKKEEEKERREKGWPSLRKASGNILGSLLSMLSNRKQTRDIQLQRSDAVKAFQTRTAAGFHS